MGKANREANLLLKEKSKHKRKVVRALILAGIILCIAAIVVVYNVTTRANSAFQNLNVALSEDGSLRVARSALGDGFNYVHWGSDKDIILYRNDDGVIKAAFDSCQDCYHGTNVHFTRVGSTVNCGNCGMTTSTAHFGEQEWGGECQPVSIPDAGRMDTETEIVIDSTVFDFAADMFSHWDEGEMGVTFESFEA